MDQSQTLDLVIGYTPSVLMILLSALLLGRRASTSAWLMLIGSVLAFGISVLFRLLQDRPEGSFDMDVYMIFSSLRMFLVLVGRSLFAIGVLGLIHDHLRGGARDPLESGGLLTDPTAARALADEIEALYRSVVLYFWLGFAALVAALILFIATLSFRMDEGGEAVLMLALIGVIALWALFTVKWCKLHYRHWRVAIELTGFNEFSASQAVGLLFVPLFNIYWMFRSYATLSEALRQAGRQPRWGGRTPIINTDTSRALCVINIFTLIPYLGAIAGLVNLFLWFNVHAQHRRAVVHMLRASAVPAPETT